MNTISSHISLVTQVCSYVLIHKSVKRLLGRWQKPTAIPFDE